MKTQDDRRCVKWAFAMRAVVGLLAIRLSNDGKWVFNMACTMVWCHTVVHVEVKMSRF